MTLQEAIGQKGTVMAILRKAVFDTPGYRYQRKRRDEDVARGESWCPTVLDLLGDCDQIVVMGQVFTEPGAINVNTGQIGPLSMFIINDGPIVHLHEVEIVEAP